MREYEAIKLRVVTQDRGVTPIDLAEKLLQLALAPPAGRQVGAHLERAAVRLEAGIADIGLGRHLRQCEVVGVERLEIERNDVHFFTSSQPTPQTVLIPNPIGASFLRNEHIVTSMILSSVSGLHIVPNRRSRCNAIG